jgi:putative sigma-54 modulation protein
MTAEEAVMRLDDQENQFLVFRNAENERISVIYKRKDGNFGLIQPQ